MQHSPHALILASASPQRSTLLRELGIDFTVQPCPLHEPNPPAAVPPRAWGEAMAYYKARAVADQHPGQWVLGADTVVSCAGHHLGKAVDEADARRMLELQSRAPADVTTGFCLVRRTGDATERTIRTALSRVALRDDPAERERYLATGDWAGKAGAYGIQNLDDKLVERVEGSLSNIVGLPIESLQAVLTEVGVASGAAPQSAEAQQTPARPHQTAPGGE